jgi:hypothetical protein
MTIFWHFIKKRKFVLVIAMIVFLLLDLVWICSLKMESNYLDRAKRISFLIDELASTPERQQRAMDEIVKDESGAFIFLLTYLDDRRFLASKDVMFLNTHPRSFERYFHAGGTRVDETILRYLCWKTGSCDVTFNLEDAQSVKIQRDKVEQYINNRFMRPNKYEN